MLLSIQVVFVLALLSACVGIPPFPAESSAVQQCPVCRFNRDFTCLDVAKTPQTPTARYGDRIYWFCSEKCRRQFEQRPNRYMPSP